MLRKKMINKVRIFCNENKIEDRIFDIAWIIFLLSRLFVLTAWCVEDSKIGGNMENILQIIMIFSLLLFAFVILIKLINKEYTWKILIFFALFFIVAVISFFVSDAKSFLAYSFIFIASYKLNGKRIISLSLLTYCFFYLLIIITFVCGLSTNIIINDTGRMGLGFNYCTTAPILLFFIFLQYVFLRKEKMKIWEYIIFEAINILIFILCGTRFAFLLMSTSVVFFAIQSFLKNRWKLLRKLKVLWLILPLIICILSILICILYKPEVDIWIKINKLLHSRLKYSKRALDAYSINLFGNDIVWVGHGNSYAGKYNFVDCAYLQILLRSGILALILILAVYCFLIYRAIKKNDYWLVFITLIICVFSAVEPCLLDMSSNTLIILAFASWDLEPITYSKGWLKKIFI